MFFFCRKSKGGFAPAFKPIGQSSQTASSTSASTTTSDSTKAGVKRSQESVESQAKIAQKKAKIAKFGLKFQSAGTLVTIGEQLGRQSAIRQPPPATKEKVESGEQKHISGHSSNSRSDRKDGTRVDSARPTPQQAISLIPAQFSSNSASSEKKLSFGFNKKSSSFVSSKTVDDKRVTKEGSYTSTWKTTSSTFEAAKQIQSGTGGKGPPPKLMSRQRELHLQGAFDSDSDEEDNSLTKLPVKAAPKFRFNLRK